MGIVRDFWSSRRARWQADALKANAEARLHERRGALAAKPHKSASELMEQKLLESVGVGMLGGWGDQSGAVRESRRDRTVARVGRMDGVVSRAVVLERSLERVVDAH